MLFISYSTKNTGKKFAGDLKRELESACFYSFLAHEDIRPNKDWVQSILVALRTCTGFVGVLDNGFAESGYCQQELGAALSLEKPILLIPRTRLQCSAFLAQWRQFCKRERIVTELRKHPEFRLARVSSYIWGMKDAPSFEVADKIHNAFQNEWGGMNKDERLEWLKSSSSNNQVYEARYGIGPCFESRVKEMRPQITSAWLKENDPEKVIRSIIQRLVVNRAPLPPRTPSRREQMRA